MDTGEFIFQLILGFVVGMAVYGVYRMCKKWYDKE